MLFHKLIIQLFIPILAASFFAQYYSSSLSYPYMWFIIPFILLIMLKYPFGFFILCFFIFYDGFGLIPTNIRIGGINEISDLCFIGLFIPALIKIYKKEVTLDDFKSNISVWIIIFLSYCIFEIIRTSYEYPEVDFISIIQISRKFFYYSLFFVFVCYLDTDERIDRFLKIILAAVNIAVLIAIFQSFFPRIGLLPYVQLRYMEIAGVQMATIRSSLVVPITIFFVYSFWHYSFLEEKRRYYLFSAIVCFLGIAFTFSRSRLSWGLFAIILPIIFLSVRNRARIFIKIMTILTVIILIIGVVDLFVSDIDYLEIAYNHFGEALDHLIHQKGTFKSRVEMSTFRFELIKQNPFIGVGFIHGKHTEKLFSRLMYVKKTHETNIETTDSGLISLLTVFGLAGVVIFLILIFMIFRKLIILFKKLKTEKLSRDYVLVVTIFGWFFAGVGSFITLGIFTKQVELVMLMVLFAILHRIELRIRRTNGRISNTC